MEETKTSAAKDAKEIEKTDAEIKDLSARLEFDKRKLDLDTKRLYLDTAKFLADMLDLSRIESSGIGSELKFCPILDAEESKQVKLKIDSYIKKI